jgi:hypothetical protein
VISGEQDIQVEASVKDRASGYLLAARQVALIVERVNEDGKGPASHTFLLVSKSIGRYALSLVGCGVFSNHALSSSTSLPATGS